MERQEIKYLVPIKKLPVLKRALEPYTIYDKYSAKRPDNNYTVRSIYFDTLRLDFYHDKIAGLKRRKKLRVRGYDEGSEESIIFLEIKRKNSQIVSKSRAPIHFKNLTEIIDTGKIGKFKDTLNILENGVQDASNFMYHIYRSNLKPTIKVIYEREAYYYRFSKDFRITLDKNLRSSLVIEPDSLYDEVGIIYSLPEFVILEIKIPGELPQWLRDIIAILKLRQQSVSKYTICIDAHSPYEPILNRAVSIKTKYNQHKTYKNWEMDIKEC
jgi:SPX domain protein involved in polyphosphate accumulation